MHPRLFEVLGVAFPSYFMLLTLGFLVATALGVVWAKRIGHDPDVIVDLGIGMLVAGVVGARLLHVVADGYFWDYVHICTDPSAVSWHITRAECGSPGLEGAWDAARAVCVPEPHRDFTHQLGRCFSWANLMAGGFTYYGGFIGATVAAVFILRRDHFPFWRAADMAGMVVPLGLAFGRMGCLLAGCCFGAPLSGPWGVSFPPRSPASDVQWKLGQIPSPSAASLPVHSTQIYESVACLGIAALMTLVLHERKRYDGQIFFAFVGLYAIARFILEFWRSDDRGGMLGLSTSQLIGIVLIAAAAAGHRVLSRRASRHRDAVPSPSR